MPEKTMDKRAIIIGISDYEHLPPLKVSKRDVDAIYNLFTSLGYDINENHKLVGYVKWDALRTSLMDFFTNPDVRSEDVLLFYFSGSGTLDHHGNAFLCPSDIDPDRPYLKGIPLSDLNYLMNLSMSARVVALVDSCYSGSIRRNVTGETDSNRNPESDWFQEKVSNLEGKGGYLMASCQGYAEASASKIGDIGIFTHYLIEGLKGANGDSVNKEGNVTPQSLGRYVYDKITEYSPQQKPVTLVVGQTDDTVLASYPSFAENLESRLTDWLSKGNSYLDSNELTKAILYYDKALDVMASAEAWNNRGVALTKLGRNKEAITSFRNALEINPDLGSLNYNLAHSLYEIGDYKEAMDYLGKIKNKSYQS